MSLYIYIHYIEGFLKTKPSDPRGKLAYFVVGAVLSDFLPQSFDGRDAFLLCTPELRVELLGPRLYHHLRAAKSRAREGLCLKERFSFQAISYIYTYTHVYICIYAYTNR